jgi:FkbM family methyltransferase
MERRSFLGGALSGVLLGGGTGLAGGRWSKADAPKPAEPSVSPARAWPAYAHLSYAQQGEDLIVEDLLHWFKIQRPAYLDIGANDPVHNNNTYLFYAKGARGVLVEPNPAFCDKLRKERPGDRVLEVGVADTDKAEADFYVIRGASELNTFSKEQADLLVKQHGPDTIEKVVKMPLVNVNEIIAQNFDVAPNFVSIDTEGLDLTILKALDWGRFRPHVLCVETLDTATGKVDEAIVDHMRAKNYSIRGATFVNTIFLANELLGRGPVQRD